jgi:hypothetical protein
MTDEHALRAHADVFRLANIAESAQQAGQPRKRRCTSVLTLTDFRNMLSLAPPDPGAVVFTGENGAGKLTSRKRYHAKAGCAGQPIAMLQRRGLATLPSMPKCWPLRRMQPRNRYDGHGEKRPGGKSASMERPPERRRAAEWLRLTRSHPRWTDFHRGGRGPATPTVRACHRPEPRARTDYEKQCEDATPAGGGFLTRSFEAIETQMAKRAPR